MRTDLLQQPCGGGHNDVKNLLMLHTQMAHLDKLMDTNFFDEANFDGLIEKLREEEKISSVERAVQSHVSRLFSHGEGSAADGNTEINSDKSGNTEVVTSPDKEDETGSNDLRRASDTTMHSTPDKDSGVDSFIESPKQSTVVNPQKADSSPTSSSEATNQMNTSNSENSSSSTKDNISSSSNVCDKLRTMLKGQLELAHDVARQKYGDQTLQDFTKIFELCENVLDNVDSELELLNFIPCDTPVLESKSFLSPSSPDPDDPESMAAALVSGGDGGSGVVPLTPGSFQTVESVPDGHKFKLTIFQPRKMKPFVRSIKKEIELLR